MSEDPKGYETLIESGQRVRMEGETGSVRRGLEVNMSHPWLL